MAWPPAIVSRRVALVVYGLTLLVYLIVSGLFVAMGLDPRGVVVAAQIVGIAGLAFGLAAALRLPLIEVFSLRPAAPVHWKMVLVAAVPMQIAGGALQFAVLRELPADSLWRRAMEQAMGQFVAVEGGFDLLMLFLAAVVVAAVCEELFFRGLLLQLLRRRAGWRSAVIWSAALFAVFHLNPIVLLPVTLLGIYLALLVWRSGSLYPAVAAHALNNGLALFGLPLLISEAVYARFVWAILLLSSTMAVALVAVYLRRTAAAPARSLPGDDGSPLTNAAGGAGAAATPPPGPPDPPPAPPPPAGPGARAGRTATAP